MTMDRAAAWELLCEYTKTDQLRRHGLSVESVMRAAAREYGGDPDFWGITGLLHDFDYESFPDQHPMAGKPILEARGVPNEIVYAIQCHADFTGYERRSMMDKMIFAMDELTGFVIACTLVQPNRSLSELKTSSVRKKLKDKAFARTVIREDIWKGMEELAVDFDEHVNFVISALKPIAPEIGLNP
jgi:putative nucleotidyltransferase with HDIG domain